jgi:hypothetical protein
VIDHGDFRYVLIYTTGGEGQTTGACLFRLSKSDPPWKWLAWDGSAFTISPRDPYRSTTPSIPCKTVGKFPNAVASVVSYHDYFIATFSFGNEVRYKISGNLIDWSDGELLATLPGPSSTNCADKARYAYPVLIDNDSPSQGFQTVNDTAWLYVVRWNIHACSVTRDRDLVRFPVTISVQ